MAKLKIDLNLGLIEVEAEDGFVKAIYEDYKSHLLSDNPKAMTNEKNKHIKPNFEMVKKEKTIKKKRAQYSIVKDLNFAAGNGIESLKEFYAKKNPKVAMERNAVFVYYLQKIKEENNITSNHIYSCYKDIGNIKIPELYNSLIDTSRLKGWIDTSSLENIKLTVAGENFVNINLEKREKQIAASA